MALIENAKSAGTGPQVSRVDATAADSLSVTVSEEYQVAQARQVCRTLALKLGFSRSDVCCIETSVSELATNLLSHTRQGGILFFREIKVPSPGIEITSFDEGPGIDDISLAMRDGYSTNGGLGCGLPGVKRLMDDFEIRSQKGTATVIVAVKRKRCR